MPFRHGLQTDCNGTPFHIACNYDCERHPESSHCGMSENRIGPAIASMWFFRTVGTPHGERTDSQLLFCIYGTTEEAALAAQQR
jgi:hypothetical protein